MLTTAFLLSACTVFADDASLALPTGDVYEVEFTFRADVIAMETEDAPDGIAAIYPAKLSTGDAGFCVWGDGIWNETAAPGDEPTTNEWCDAKFSVRTIDGEKLVSYFVKSGGAYVQLSTTAGRSWFKATAGALMPEVEFQGAGEGVVVGSLAEESGETFVFD